jgi:hypothetical protein
MDICSCDIWLDSIKTQKFLSLSLIKLPSLWGIGPKLHNKVLIILGSIFSFVLSLFISFCMGSLVTKILGFQPKQNRGHPTSPPWSPVSRIISIFDAVDLRYCANKILLFMPRLEASRPHLFHLTGSSAET